MWKVGDVKIPSHVVVVLTAGISNTALRVTVKKFGAGLAVHEMISDKGIKLRNKKTSEMLYVDEREYPSNVRTSGGDKEILVETAKFVEENTQAAVIDINMGYPVNKITKAEVGAKWLLDPNKVYEMVHTISSAVSLPVIVKTRIGQGEDHLYVTDNALVAGQAGASAITMRGRTRVQMYEETANQDVLKEAKKYLTVPFMGNGDVKTLEDAKRVLEYIGADGVVIGRAALGNPWMIQRTKEHLETGGLMPESSPAEKINIIKIYLQRLVGLKGKKVTVHEFRQHASHCLKGTSRAAKAKVVINQVETQQAVVDLLDAFIEKIFKVTVTTIKE